MIIAFTNHKGGTGKTTSVVNIAKVLSDKGHSVLMVDLDPQANLTYSHGITDIEYSVADMMMGKANINDLLYGDEKLGLLPADFSMNDKHRIIESLPNSNNLLRNKLSNLPYDFILLDCPPAISVYTKNALNAADGVIIPMQMEVLSLQGLMKITEVIENVKQTTNPQLEILGVLGVLVDERRQLTNEILEYIMNNFEINVFNNRVRNSVKAAEAPSFGVSVVEYAPTSNSAKDYVAVTNELLKKIRNK
jgi:chromosome partitioning protein